MKLKKLTKEQLKRIVERVEIKLFSHIITPDHITDCRCGLCWVKFQAEWVTQ